jgi:hypothetical protein
MILWKGRWSARKKAGSVFAGEAAWTRKKAGSVLAGEAAWETAG